MKLLAHVYAHPSSVHRHLHTSVATPPSERPADGSLRSDFSPISISGRGLHWGRGAIPLEPSPAASIRKPSSASLGVIQDMCLDDTDKGRKRLPRSRDWCARRRHEAAKPLLKCWAQRSRRSAQWMPGVTLNIVATDYLSIFCETRCNQCSEDFPPPLLTLILEKLFDT